MKSANGWYRVFCVCVMALTVAFAGCSTGDDDSPMNPGGFGGVGPLAGSGAEGEGLGGEGGSSGFSANGGGMAATGGGVAATSGGGTGASVAPTSGSGGGLEEGEECAAAIIDPVPVEMQVEVEVPVIVTHPQPIAIYVLLDQSSSMVDAAQQPLKWNTAVDALKAFAVDPASAHMYLALQFFPLDGVPTGTCDGNAYATPNQQLGVLELPDAQGAMAGLLDSTPPPPDLAAGVGWRLTPIEAALRGATTFCQQYQASDETKCVAVLITDGEPTDCAGSTMPGGATAGGVSILYDIADQAWEGGNVMTFAVGMQGADFNILNNIAMVGATDCDGDPNNATYACNVGATGGATMTLTQAFEAIRDFVTQVESTTEIRKEYETRINQCEFLLPEPEPGEKFDPSKVQIVLITEETLDEGGVALPRREDGDCAAATAENPWVYDDPTGFHPTTAILCPQTCATVTSTVGATIGIRVGCVSPVD